MIFNNIIDQRHNILELRILLVRLIEVLKHFYKFIYVTHEFYVSVDLLEQLFIQSQLAGEAEIEDAIDHIRDAVRHTARPREKLDDDHFPLDVAAASLEAVDRHRQGGVREEPAIPVAGAIHPRRREIGRQAPAGEDMIDRQAFVVGELALLASLDRLVEALLVAEIRKLAGRDIHGGHRDLTVTIQLVEVDHFLERLPQGRGVAHALGPERREALLDELWDDLPKHWLEEGRQRRKHHSLHRQVLLKDRWDELPGWDELPVHRHRRHMREGGVGHRFEQRESCPPGLAQRLDAGPGQDGGIDGTDRDPGNDLRCEVLPPGLI